MPRMLRLTCARTTYFELEIQAEEGACAEDLLAAAIESDAKLCEHGPIGQPTYRIVDIVGQEGEAVADPRAQAA